MHTLFGFRLDRFCLPHYFSIFTVYFWETKEDKRYLRFILNEISVACISFFLRKSSYPIQPTSGSNITWSGNFDSNSMVACLLDIWVTEYDCHPFLYSIAFCSVCNARKLINTLFDLLRKELERLQALGNIEEAILYIICASRDQVRSIILVLKDVY